MTPKSYYLHAYYEALDLAINAIQDRFDQPGYKTYRHLEELLVKAARDAEIQSDLDAVCDFYGTDFDQVQLQLQLQTLQATLKSKSATLKDVKQFIVGMSESEQALISEVIKLLQLILVLPSTNAASERTFSAMRRLKTYLRATMRQERLNHLLLLHVHKDRTDALSCTEVAKTFVRNSEHRLSIFGRFK